MSRPRKLSNRIVKVFRQILEDDMNVLMCTDWELCHMLNKHLRRSERISYRTFQRYKRDALIVGFINDDDTDNECWDDIDPIYSQLFELFADALINQKKALGMKILNDEKGYRRYQWMLERKFKEWNIRWTNGEADREQTFLANEEEKWNQEAHEKIELVPEYLSTEEIKRRMAMGMYGGIRQSPKNSLNHEKMDLQERQEDDADPEKRGGSFGWDEGMFTTMDSTWDVSMDSTGYFDEPDTSGNPCGSPPPPPDKPLPYWKRPGYEPSPDRLRRLF